MADTSDPKPKAARKPAAPKKAPARPKAAAARAKPAKTVKAAPKSAGPKAKPRTKAGNTTDWMAEAEKLRANAGKAAWSAAEFSKAKTGSALAGLARLIGDTAGTVDEKMGAQYGDYARYAAEAVANAGQTLDAKDLEQLTAEARDFVRKSPAVAIGAAAVLGFVVMRLAKGPSDKA